MSWPSLGNTNAMAMCKSLIFIFTLFLSLNVLAQDKPLTKKEIIVELNKFKEIAFDVRGSRGGNGDVAAAYLTAMDLLRNYSLHSKITFITDEKSEAILYRIAQGNDEFEKSISISRAESLPHNKEFDLYFALAGPSGKFSRASDIIDSENVEVSFADKYIFTYKKIKIAEHGVLIAQTVLGNTENSNSIYSQGTVRSNGVSYSMGPAGIGDFESGIYGDYIAEHLKDKTTQEINEFIFGELPTVTNTFSREVIEAILKGTRLKNSTFGLAYGISMKETQLQFMSYLEGLAKESTKSFVIVTPSSISIKTIVEANLWDRVVILTERSQIPEIAQPGKIYIVKVRTLPHSVFTGLLARSMSDGLVPVGAGDGFMSAAITLGKAFVLTGVEWNRSNIRNLNQLLWRHSNKAPEVMNLLNENYVMLDFKNAQLLKTIDSTFGKLSEQVPSLTERIANAAILVQKISKSSEPNNEKISKQISDETLRNSVRVGGIKEEVRIIKQIKWHQNNLRIALYKILNSRIQIGQSEFIISLGEADQLKIDNLFFNIGIMDKFLDLLFGKRFEEKVSETKQPIEAKNEYKAEYIKMNLEKSTNKKLNSRVVGAIKSIFDSLSLRSAGLSETTHVREELTCSQLFR